MKTSRAGLEDRTELIRRKAYELYLEKGGGGGTELEDWLQAEKAVDAELAAPPVEARETEKAGPRIVPAAPAAKKAEPSTGGDGFGQRLKGKLRRSG